MKKVNVLIVDDSAIVRKILSEELAKDPYINVLGTAPDPYIARDKILKLDPDVLILDIEMPRMDGLTFLKKIMRYHPMPVIIVSSLTQKGSEKAFEALSLGAVDVMAKPGGPYSVGEMKVQLIEKVKAVSKALIKNKQKNDVSVSQTPRETINPSQSTKKKKIIVIGASTGGTEAIKEVLCRLPKDIPGILIVQHMPAFFTKPFAKRLNDESLLDVYEAKRFQMIEPGTALVAPGGFHLVMKKNSSGYYAETRDGPMVHHQKPAVDVLFKSVANVAGSEAIAVLLTGMGKDGALGMLALKDAGSYNIAQDESTSVIFGMPKEAINLGASHAILPLDRIANEIVKVLMK